MKESFLSVAPAQGLTSDLRRMVGRPFGVDENGRPIAWVNGKLIAGAIEHMLGVVEQRARQEAPPGIDLAERAARVSQARTAALDRLVRMLNAAIEDERYHVSGAYLLNSSHNYSTEFWLFVVDYCRVVSGDPDFFFNHAAKTIPSTILALARPFSLQQVYSLMSRFAAKFASADLRVVRTTPTSAVIQWQGARAARHVQTQHRAAYLRASCSTYKGAYAAVPSLLHPDTPPARVIETRCQADGAECCEWEITWQNPERRERSRVWLWIGAAVSALLLAYGLLRLPGFEWLALMAALLPAVLAWYVERTRRLDGERERLERLLLEQRDLSEAQYDRGEQVNAELQIANVELKHKISELTVLHEIGLTLSATRDLKELLDESLRAVVAHLRFDRALVMLAVQREGRQVLSGGRGIGGAPETAAVIAQLEISLDDRTSQLAQVFHADRPLLFRDVGRDGDEGNRALARALGVESWLGTPLIAKGRRIGTLCVGVDNGRTGRAISQAEADLLFTVGNQIASAVDSARLYQTLEQRVAERTAELGQANTHLQQEIAERRRADEALRRQNEYLAALHDTTLGLVSRLDVKDLLEALVTRAGQLLGTPHGFIYLATPDGAELERQVGVGVFNVNRAPRLKPGEGLSGQVWQTGRSIVVNDYDSWPGRSASGVSLIDAMVGVPLYSGSKVMGVLSLASERGSKRTFGDAEVELLGRFAQLASIALDNARLYAAAQQEVAERRQAEKVQAALYRIAEAASAAEDMPEFYAAVHRIVGELTYAKNFFIALYDEASGLINFPYFVDEMDSEIPPQKLDKGGLAAYAIRTGQPYHDSPEKFAELLRQGEVAEIGEPSVDWLGVPLKTERRTLGALVVQSYTEGLQYTEKDLDLLTFVAQHIATALERARLLGETRQRMAELAIINSVGQALASQLEMEAVIDLVGDKIREIFDAQIVYMALRGANADRQAHVIQFPYYFDRGRRIATTPLALGEGLTSIVIQSRQPLALGTLQQQMELGGVFDDNVRAESWLGVPIVVGDQAIGAISLQNMRENAFSDADVRLLMTLAANLGVAIENARLFEETKRLLAETGQRAAELAIVNSVGQALASHLELGALIELAGERMRQTFGAQIVYVALLDRQSNLIQFPYYYDSDRRRDGYTQSLGQGLTSKIIELGRPLLLNQEQQYAELNVARIGTRSKSYLGVPITVGEEVIGAISVQSTAEEGRFGEADARLLTTIAANVGVALQNARLYQEARRRADELAIINDIGQALASELELGAMMEVVAEKIRQVFNVDVIYIALLDRQTNLISFPYWFENGQRIVTTDTLSLGEGLTSQVIQSRQPQLINAAWERRAAELGAVYDGEPAKCSLGVPIMSASVPSAWLRGSSRDASHGASHGAGQAAIGMISLQSYERENLFTETDVRLLTTIANNMGVAIESARLYEETRRRANEMAALTEIGREISATLDLPTVLERIAVRAQTVLNARDVVLRLLEPDGSLPAVVAIGQYAEAFKATPLRLGQGLVGHAAQRGVAEVVNYPLQDPRVMSVPGMEQDEAQEAIIFAPMIAREKVIGIMTLWRNRTAAGLFTQSDLDFLVGLARQAAIAIENARLFKETQRARQAAEEANESKSAFLSSVSHELRTPLTSVLGFAKIIQKRLEERIFPAFQAGALARQTQRAVDQVRENIGIIVAEGERLTALINDLLDLAKIEAGKVDWHMQPLAISDVIDRAMAATAALFEQKGLRSIKDARAGLPKVIGDEGRLMQVMINLISNAVKFTPAGSVTCKARQSDGEIIVSVVDTGVGIAETDQPRIFERFKQVGDTLKEKPQGTGLGLPICKEIVEHHGGRIWVESEPGKGSTFSFSLPVGADEAAAGVTAPSIDLDTLIKQLTQHVVSTTPTSTGYQKRILVVDDDAHIRRLLAQELGEAGYQVKVAQDGGSALTQIRNEKPDLVILDVLMPGISGFDVAAVLKNDPQTMGIPIIILSIVEDEERGYRLGVDRYLTKPVNTATLLKEVETLLAQGPSRRKVLVVDEDASTVRALSEVLRAKGYSVAGAHNGEELIEKATSTLPELIVVNSVFSEQRDIAQTLRFEKRLENVFILMYQREDR